MMSDRPHAHVSQRGALYRHGDVLIQRMGRLPHGVAPRAGTILAHGELTGHTHRLEQGERVQLWERGNELFLEVKAPSASLIHEEHRAIELPQGVYRVWRQREYRPDVYVEVVD